MLYVIPELSFSVVFNPLSLLVTLSSEGVWSMYYGVFSLTEA